LVISQKDNGLNKKPKNIFDVIREHWRPTLFITLNVVFICWLGAIFEMLLRVLGGEDPLALLGILTADIAFIIIGILLFILNRYYRIPIINRILPFAAILILTVVAISNVTNTSLWIGIIVSWILIISSVFTTVRPFVASR